MQKKNIWIALLFAMPSIGFSQTLERTVVASAGATISNSSVSIDYNVGETSTNTIQNTGGAVTQGFEQPIVTKGGLSIVPNLNHSCDFEIFPNPTVGNLNYRNNSVNSANYHV
ncbi:MAG: hypothetical protein RL757_1734, partial [Bacteroidota bacterium]